MTLRFEQNYRVEEVEEQPRPDGTRAREVGVVGGEAIRRGLQEEIEQRAKDRLKVKEERSSLDPVLLKS